MAWTTPRTWVDGETVTAAIQNLHVRDNLNDLRLSWAAWTSYTPTLTGFTLGNGTITGASLTIGKTVLWRVSLTFGTTTTAASASPTFTLPATGLAASNLPVNALFYDLSTTTYYQAVGRQNSTTTVALAIPGASGVFTTPTTTTPFTWTTGDVILASGVVEIA